MESFGFHLDVEILFHRRLPTILPQKIRIECLILVNDRYVTFERIFEREIILKRVINFLRRNLPQLDHVLDAPVNSIELDFKLGPFSVLFHYYILHQLCMEFRFPSQRLYKLFIRTAQGQIAHFLQQNYLMQV